MSVVGLALVGEDKGHFFAVTRLVDARLVTERTWLDGVLAECRTWRGLAPGEPWYKYDPDDAFDVRPIEIDGVRIAPQGFIAGEPLKPEAGMWRRVLLLFVHSKPRPDVVVLVRDLDGYPGRREGIEQVRNGFFWPFPVVVAAPEPEIEAWHVAGFVPEDDSERALLDEVRAKLSFDPTTQSHRLTSHPNDAATDAKRVLGSLRSDDEDRRIRCLDDRDLLDQRGERNGLTKFLAEIDTRIVPAFGVAP